MWMVGLMLDVGKPDSRHFIDGEFPWTERNQLLRTNGQPINLRLRPK